MRIREMDESERPRERLWENGPEALKTSELIAIMLRTGLQGKSAIALGEEMMTLYPSLDDLCRTPAQEIARIKGIGMAKAVQLKAAFELAIRLASSKRRELPVRTPEDVHLLLGEEMRQLSYESLRVVALNTRLNLIAIKEISRGNINETVACTRDVLRAALDQQAHSFVLVHNHPSGDPAPSQPDFIFTQKVRDAARLLEVGFNDHIILGVASQSRPHPYYSFKKEGYL